jgi:integrase
LRPLAKVRRIGGDEVFADSEGRVVFPRGAWESAVRAAEIEDFRFHDLRHSAASYLAQCGASLAEIAQFLGHKTLQGVQRYAHLTDQRSQRGVDRMHERLFDPDA